MYLTSTTATLLTVCVLVVLWVFFSKSNKSYEPFSSALDHPTKCFDCELQHGPRYAWVGQPTKCFSCEQQALRLSGGDPMSVFNEHPVKYYESTPLGGMGLAKMGYVR